MTDDMFIIEGPTVEAPNETPIKNFTAEGVRRMLDEMCGLTNLDFTTAGITSGFTSRPSFRDFGAFTYQPQNVVANPDILFYKTDTREHREKLRTIFPYVLGAITPAILAKQHELDLLTKELRRKEREFNEVQKVSGQWLAEIRSKVAEARELGLIDSPLPEEMSKEAMLELLSCIIRSPDPVLQVSETTISEALQELRNLEEEERTVSLHLSGLRRRLNEMNRLRESSSNYREALHIQRDRLKIADWMVAQHTDKSNCPLCGNQMDEENEKLQQLQSALRELEIELGEMREIPASFDREYQRVLTAAKETAEKLQSVNIRIKALGRRSEEAQQRQYRASRVSRFVGNLENALEIYGRLGQSSDLATVLTSIRERIQQLTAEVDAASTESRKRRALAIVNANAARLLPDLDCERPTDPIALNISELTVQVTGVNRTDYLWEIGSGSNWLAYHLAIMFGLHKFFMNQENSAIPSFLTLDQPSQVYFPKHLVQRSDDTEDDPQLLRDEDIEAVRKAFYTMSSVVQTSNGEFQMIVLDHAPESVWGEIPNIYIVDEWRNGRKLVPLDWLD